MAHLADAQPWFAFAERDMLNVSSFLGGSGEIVGTATGYRLGSTQSSSICVMPIRGRRLGRTLYMYCLFGIDVINTSTSFKWQIG